MTSQTKITVVQRCAVFPPPRSVPSASLPLTFFDVPWLLFSPSQPLFFYGFPTSTSHFTRTILPNLKHALCLTLRHFFPLAGKLVEHVEPSLDYTDAESSLSFTVAQVEAPCHFKNLLINGPKTAREFHALVPPLNGTDAGPDSNSDQKPVLAIQITVFPEFGICMGFALRHVAADGRTFNNFLKTWAAFAKHGEMSRAVDRLVGFHDRSVVSDPNGLKKSLLKEWWEIKKSQKGLLEPNGPTFFNVVRATFMLGPFEMDHIKKWILTRSENLFGSTQMLLSPYVVTCALVWFCWMKTHWSSNEGCGESMHYFGFIAGGITRLQYKVPTTYVGNCVSFGRSMAARSDLIGEDGIVFAAKAIGDTIMRLNGDVLGGAENWIREWEEIRGSELHLMVSGSPKLDSYGLDFGWGKPVKIEEVSIETTRAISLSESREIIGGIEIGLALPKAKMDIFCKLFYKGLS